MNAFLIDLSSLAYPIWHTCQDDPDPNAAAGKIVDRVRSIAGGNQHVAICCDSGVSFRAEIDPNYKGNRPERDERLAHQINLSMKRLDEDGFPIWAAKGFEADDLIATGVRRLGRDVTVVSADKDMLQLVNDETNIRQMFPNDGRIVTAVDVLAKLQVRPDQICDYLTIIGDESDNIPGIKGVGPAGASSVLKKWGTLDAFYKELNDIGGKAMGLTDVQTKKFVGFQLQMPTSRRLIQLRDDAPISDEAFGALLAERTMKPSTNSLAADGALEASDWEVVEEEETVVAPRSGINPPQSAPAPVDDLPTPTEPPAEAPQETLKKAQAAAAAMSPNAGKSIAVRPPDELAPMPEDYERQMDPRSIGQAYKLALEMHRSGMFADYGSAQAVLSTALVGRELGIPFMTSLRTIHVIKGKHALSAQLIVAMCLKNPLCEYFRRKELTLTSCTYVTKRRGDPEMEYTHTIDDAKTAGLWKADSNWMKIPKQMLMARASVILARDVYPDIVANVYTKEELEELAAAA